LIREKVNYETLVEAFWHMHDPTQVNRQGRISDAISHRDFHALAEQEATAKGRKPALEASKKFQRPIATEITSAGKFYRAENITSATWKSAAWPTAYLTRHIQLFWRANFLSYR